MHEVVQPYFLIPWCSFHKSLIELVGSGDFVMSGCFPIQSYSQIFELKGRRKGLLVFPSPKPWILYVNPPITINLYISILSLSRTSNIEVPSSSETLLPSNLRMKEESGMIPRILIASPEAQSPGFSGNSCNQRAGLGVWAPCRHFPSSYNLKDKKLTCWEIPLGFVRRWVNFRKDLQPRFSPETKDIKKAQAYLLSCDAHFLQL